MVERGTGLEAYDAQVELPLSELSSQHGIAVMSTIANDIPKHRSSEHES